MSPRFESSRFIGFVLAFLVVPLALAACGDDDAVLDAGADGGALLDAGPMDAGTDAGPPPPPDVCDDLALPRRDFTAGTTGSAYGDVAGDFTVDTLDGPFTLSEAWSGCESYVFINYFDADVIRAFWAGFPDRIFDRSSRTARYFFASYDADPADARAHVADMQTRVEEALAFLDPADAEFWRARVHYVVTPLLDVDGSIGDLVRAHTSVQLAFAIDRAQRFDPVGSLAEATSSGFVNRLGMAAWASRYYDHRAELDARLEAESASTTIVPLVEETGFAEREFDRDVTLPDAAAMAAFDSLALDVSITCRAEPQDCSEWDRIAAIFVCTDETCDTRHELVRWITPYARPGNRRWVMDASPLLGLLRDGGATRFRIVMGPTWEEPTVRDVSMSIRLATQGSGDDPIGAELAFTGGAFDAGYDALHPPFHFTPPLGTTRVELFAIVSGHGQTPSDNCAEWCNHEHTFRVNGGADHRVDYPGEAGDPIGCAAHVDDGVIPGQYGNWAPSRAGWCPGWPVAPVRFDVTSDVAWSGDNEVQYAGTFMGGIPRGGDIDMSLYVVYFR